MYWKRQRRFQLAQVQPGALEFGITPGVPMGILIYDSFVTLTAVWLWRDAPPIAASARSMAVMEAVLGHFYLTVLIARLVGLSIANSRKPAADVNEPSEATS